MWHLGANTIGAGIVAIEFATTCLPGAEQNRFRSCTCRRGLLVGWVWPTSNHAPADVQNCMTSRRIVLLTAKPLAGRRVDTEDLHGSLAASHRRFKISGGT